MGIRTKVYTEGSRPDIRVPFTEVAVGDSPGPHGPVPNAPVRLYDTSGPGSDPAAGLPPLRRPWVLGREDVEEYDGRPVSARDDGRAAVRRGAASEQFAGSRQRPLRARADRRVTQLHYARRGDV